MKKLMMILVALATIAGVATAAPKAEKKIVTVVFATDIDCPHCAQKVMNSIPYEKGIKNVQTDVPTKTVTVSFDAEKNSIEALIKAFAGIKVKVFKAEEKK